MRTIDTSSVHTVGANPSPELEILEMRSAHAFGSWRNMLIIVWRHETASAAVRRAKNHLLEMRKAYPHGIGLMQVAQPQAKPPDAATRAAIGDFLAAGRGAVACSSVVYGGTGFWMASFRALVAGVTMLARPGFPHHVFESVEEAADWHARLLPSVDPPAPSKIDIRRAADALIAAMAQGKD
jgi:hypothetical protein